MGNEAPKKTNKQVHRAYSTCPPEADDDDAHEEVTLGRGHCWIRQRPLSTYPRRHKNKAMFVYIVIKVGKSKYLRAQCVAYVVPGWLLVPGETRVTLKGHTGKRLQKNVAPT